MRVRHTIATFLAFILLIQTAGAAQAPPELEVRAVPHEQAVRILLGNLGVGTEVRVEVSGRQAIVGRLVEKSDDELVVAVSGQRHVIPLADVISIRRPPPRHVDGGKAFGIGAAVGAGILAAIVFFSYFAR